MSFSDSATFVKIQCHLEHKCKWPGCGNVLVIDGNIKNRCDVCAAKEAGHIEYEGLPGSIKTGCQLSPGYQSKFCNEHSPRVSQRENDDECVVNFITAKRKTRINLL